MHTLPVTRGGIEPAGFDVVHDDFIPHPAAFPLRYRREGRRPWRPSADSALAGDVGLSFHSPRYFAAGTRIALDIPLRGVTQHFVGTVVLVREVADGYQIGLWFADPAEAARARLVERICHTECYLRARRPA